MKIKLRDYQEGGVAEIRAAFREKLDPVLFVLPTGGGKCLGAGTPVLMFDGTIMPVEQVCVDDLLMGPDSTPRRVLSLARGREMLYRVTPKKGDPYVVNESHILSLRNRRGVVTNIEVRDYIKEPRHWQIRNQGWRVPGILRGDLTPELVDITVEPIGVGDYYGFEIDGDHLFMLGDFTVTHNTYTFSYIAANAAEKAPAPHAGMEYILIVVHRKELLLQASASLRNLDVDHGLISPHFTPMPQKRIQVASIDTLAIRIQKRPIKVRLLIFDEAHHVVAGNKWGRLYEALGRPPTLGVTATPVRSDGKGLGEHAGGVFQTMVLGPSIAELIERGMLLNPVVYTSLEQPDLSGLKKDKDGDYNRKELAERVDKPVITGSAVEQYRTVCPGARAIVFCASIAHAQHVASEFNSAGYRFAILVGEPAMSDAERTAVNKALRSGELDGACTVDLVSEGYDLPDLECCIMLRPTASESLFIQQVGRVMRPSDGKSACYLLDHVGNVGKIADGEFKRKHGLPSELREWTLDGRVKAKKGKKQPQEKTVDVTQCPKCYLVHEPAPACPKCGHVYEVKGRNLEQVDGMLVQVTEEMTAQQKKERRQEVGKAQTLEELQRIAAERGYKPSWARIQWEMRTGKKAKTSDRPPEPSMAELQAMTLDELEKTAEAQGWPRDFASKFFYSKGAGVRASVPYF